MRVFDEAGIMISASSDCSRIDAVKAANNQLRLEVTQQKNPGDGTDAATRADHQIDNVDQQVRSGNAQEAEIALSGAVAAVQNLTYAAPSTSTTAKTATRYGSVDLSA